MWPEVSRMQCECAIMSSVTCPALQYFPAASLKRYNYRRKGTEIKMCVLILSTALPEAFLTKKK